MQYLGANGIGKTTLINSLVDMDAKDSGDIKWSMNANIGFFSQDAEENIDSELSLIDWMGQWSDSSDTEQEIRSVLGKLLFQKMIYINL